MKYRDYKYKVILFKFINVLILFEEMINQVLREYLDIFTIVYLDNIFFFLKIKEEY